jgi:hypothetical protein
LRARTRSRASLRRWPRAHASATWSMRCSRRANWTRLRSRDARCSTSPVRCRSSSCQRRRLSRGWRQMLLQARVRSKWMQPAARRAQSKARRGLRSSFPSRARLGRDIWPRRSHRTLAQSPARLNAAERQDLAQRQGSNLAPAAGSSLGSRRARDRGQLPTASGGRSASLPLDSTRRRASKKRVASTGRGRKRSSAGWRLRRGRRRSRRRSTTRWAIWLPQEQRERPLDRSSPAGRVSPGRVSPNHASINRAARRAMRVRHARRSASRGPSGASGRDSAAGPPMEAMRGRRARTSLRARASESVRRAVPAARESRASRAKRASPKTRPRASHSRRNHPERSPLRAGRERAAGEASAARAASASTGSSMHRATALSGRSPRTGLRGGGWWNCQQGDERVCAAQVRGKTLRKAGRICRQEAVWQVFRRLQAA